MAVISSEQIDQATQLLQNLKVKEQQKPQDQEQQQKQDASDDSSASDGSFELVVDDAAKNIPLQQRNVPLQPRPLRPGFGYISPPPYGDVYSPVPYHFPAAPYIPSPPPRGEIGPFVSYHPVVVAEPGFYHVPPCISPPLPPPSFGFGYPGIRPAWNDPKAGFVKNISNFRPTYAGPSPIGFGRGYIQYNNRQWIGKEQEENGASDVMHEQVRGPRAIKPPSKDLNSKPDESVSGLPVDQFNRSDFEVSYGNAKFFVIKSYSEDDVHKSIKYSVWSSTPKGNRRLDAAHKESQRICEETGGICPVFLFFSVNASGQFCGVAEMTGPVDFVKSMDFWQQEKKWNGFFPVQWHFIKDVPNRQLRHLTLENNDNEPVTNSRDTQEVKLKQGNEILEIFKKYSSRTSLLDDFEFYEKRQKAMQERRCSPSGNQVTSSATKS